jgi:putative transcriptional regulator
MPDKTQRSNAKPKGQTDWAALDAMTDEEAEAAALVDPDNQPWPSDKPMHKMARVKRVRMQLQLSQAEFAARYHIPLSQLKEWERHEAMPDPVAKAFIEAIAGEPDAVARALASAARHPQAAE